MASTSFLQQIFGWVLVIDSLLGYLVASGIQSPLLVDRSVPCVCFFFVFCHFCALFSCSGEFFPLLCRLSCSLLLAIYGERGAL